MSNQLMAFDFSSPVNSLDAYIARVNQVPLLTAEEESKLAKRYHDQQCIESARKLVLAHLRYVVRVARGYTGYGLALGDLIQEGNIGLMKAVKKFDPTIGVRLVSFAVHWIKSEIHEFVIKNWRIVKVATTKAQRKCFFNLRQMKKRLGWFTQDEVNQVAQDLNVKPDVVMQMEQRLNAMDLSFDTPDEDDDNPYHVPAHTLTSCELNPAHEVCEQDSHQQRMQAMQQAMQQLDDRSREILQARYITDNKVTLQELAEKYHVSAERIRQIEANALTQIRRAMSLSN